MFKLLVIGVIIIGKDPFALLGMQAPGIWEWGQGNKVRFTGTVGVIKALILWESVNCHFHVCVRGWGQDVGRMQLSMCFASPQILHRSIH